MGGLGGLGEGRGGGFGWLVGEVGRVRVLGWEVGVGRLGSWGVGRGRGERELGGGLAGQNPLGASWDWCLPTFVGCHPS